ncbi:hypothetical protein EXU57_17325 [Segetibacter sp. 3557_3]|uniref:hypothetical protein n=1 Tax=Segetibacter sp. 3557_3 TaxID=2547429 RepID=UPI001058D009|nr:hypothetical protein [Segetibacter sp. 3557_3]TDH23238.1 hypothetical protein EXU57_17325 [Segetibacter sp. 3557_3]
MRIANAWTKKKKTYMNRGTVLNTAKGDITNGAYIMKVDSAPTGRAPAEQARLILVIIRPGT